MSEREYGGTPLNYLGRLHKAGHGGQILVSDLTAALLTEALPPKWELLDLGDFVLKDFPRRRIFQAAHPDLERHFPPLNAPRPMHGRALPANTFVGREREVARVMATLGSGLATLIGPGGIGKSRLALEIAHRVRDDYRDGVCVIELSGLDDAGQVPAAVANALQIDPYLEATIEASILRSLVGRSLLLILDNCEHVAPAAAPLAVALGSLPGVHVLATSRTPLGGAGEILHPIGPLGHTVAGTPAVQDSEAVHLFVDRVRTLRPDFELDAGSAETVADICGCVSGIPLSIELAAAALRTVPLSMLADELRASGVIPTTAEGARARRAIEWSIESLDPDALSVFQALAVFPGGAPADLVGQLQHGGAGTTRLVAALDQLVQRALVQLEVSAAGGHYRLLEPMRLAALRGLSTESRSELETWHAGVVGALALDAEARLQSGGEADAVDDLDRLFASLRATVQLEADRDPDRAVRILLATHEFCFLRMRYEMYEWTEALLQRADLSPATASILHAISGLASFNRGDLRGATSSCLESIRLAQEAGVEPHIYAQFGLIASYGFDCQFEQAQAHFTDALTWCSNTKSDYFLVNTLVLGSMSMTIQGDAVTGHKLATGALEIGERITNPSSMAWALCAAADAQRLVSPGAAHVHLEEALTLARSVRSRWVEGQALLNLATLCWQTDTEEGAVALTAAISNAEHTGSPIHGQQALRIAALLLGRLGRLGDASLLLDPTRRNETALPPAPDVAQGLQDVRARCADTLGADVFQAYLGQGRRMAHRDLLTLARRALSEAVPA